MWILICVVGGHPCFAGFRLKGEGGWERTLSNGRQGSRRLALACFLPRRHVKDAIRSSLPLTVVLHTKGRIVAATAAAAAVYQEQVMAENTHQPPLPTPPTQASQADTQP